MQTEHGCSNWQLDTFLEGEIEETELEKKGELKSQNTHSDDEEVTLCMSKTYKLQSVDINKKIFNIETLQKMDTFVCGTTFL